jgi:hypothetical protein
MVRGCLTSIIIRALALADVVVFGDNDPDPKVREETRKLAERRAEELNGQLFFPPDGYYKDVDEWILYHKFLCCLIIGLSNLKA